MVHRTKLIFIFGEKLNSSDWLLKILTVDYWEYNYSDCPDMAEIWTSMRQFHLSSHQSL